MQGDVAVPQNSPKKMGTLDFGRNPSPLVDLIQQNVYFYLFFITSLNKCPDFSQAN